MANIVLSHFDYALNKYESLAGKKIFGTLRKMQKFAFKKAYIRSKIIEKPKVHEKNITLV